MPTKKAGSKSRAKPQPAKPRLQNLAARPSLDDTLDDTLVDHSGVFRVTNAISQAQTGHGDESTRRLAGDSVAMAAQRAGVRDDSTMDEAADEHMLVNEAEAAEKRARLATLAARNAARNRTRR